MSATAANISTRPLKPILEDVEDTKSITATDGHFFSDDEDDSIITHKATPSSGVDRITFSNSSFNALIKATSSGSGAIDSSNSTSILLQPTPSVANRAGASNTVTDRQRTVSSTLQESSASDHFSGSFLTEDDENISPWSANPFEPQFAEETGASGDAEIEDPFGFAAWESGFARRHSGDFTSTTVDKPWQSFKTVSGDVSHTTSLQNSSVSTTTRSPLKFVNPDSPVPPDPVLPGHELAESRSLREELQAAKDEIALLVEAVHEKDLSVISAYQHAEELKEKYAAERRDGPLMQQRLEAALRNASELEAKNVLLTTQIAELEARTRRMSSRFSDMASLLGLKSSSNDDKAIEREVTAKVESLLQIEKDFLSTKDQSRDDAETQHSLHKEIKSLRKQIENQERHIIQVEDFEARKLAVRDQEIRSLKDRLNLANENLQEQEKLNSALSAETKKLLAELKVSQHIIERKDSIIQELRQPDASSDSAMPSTVTSRTAELLAKSPANAAANHAVSSAEAPSNLNGKTAHVKRELRLLNAALAQVIAASDNTSNQLRLEIRDLQLQVKDLQETESWLREELRVRAESSNIQAVEADVQKVVTTHRTTQTLDDLGSVDGFQRNPAVEWTEILSLLKNLASRPPNPAGDDATHLVGLQQAQISELLAIVRHMRENAQTSSNTPTNEAEKVAPKECAEDHKLRDGIAVLQKMLTEREDEIEYWRTLLSRKDSAQPVHFLPSFPVVENELPIVYKTQTAHHSLEDQSLDGAAVPNGAQPGTSGYETFALMDHDEKNQPRKGSGNHKELSETQLQIRLNSNAFTAAESSKVVPVSPHRSNRTIEHAGSNGDARRMDPVVQQHPNHAHLSENYGQERRLSTKLELPDIDYGTIRNRSRLQLEQLQNLCRRYDQAQFRSVKLLPDNFDLAVD